MRIWKDIYKRRIQTKQRKALKSVRRRKVWLLAKRKRQLGQSLKERRFFETRSRAKHVKAPGNFSIKLNTDEVFYFIGVLKSLRKSNYKDIFIQLKHVTYISNGSIALMLSAITELKENGIKVAGSYPVDKKSRITLERSGFFDHVFGNVSEENKLSYNTIKSQENDTVDSAAVAPLVLKAMQHVWGQPFRNQKLQSFLIELMANTVNHAFPNYKKCKWHLSVSRDEAKNKATFTFIDNGEGIINTLNTKFIDRITALVLSSNANILKAAFDGEFGSRTRERKRGRGLPSIKKCFVENYITGLVVITNDAYMDFMTNRAKKLTHGFQGTCYYWELDLNCHAWKIL